MTPPTRVLAYAILFLSISGALANAQEAPDCQKQKITANVLDRHGDVVAGLRSDDFRAELGGRPLKILSVMATNARPRVVILLDLSASMSEVAELARRLARSLAITQSKKFQPALVLFSNRIIESLDFSRPPEEFASKLAKLPENKGETALFDALKYGVDLLRQPVPGDLVYVISDGGENKSKTKQDDIERVFLSRKIRICALVLFGGHFPTAEEVDGRATLMSLANLTGGAALELEMGTAEENHERLASALPKLYQQMSDFYELQLEPSTEYPRKRRGWNLVVLDGQGRKQKDVQVIYPRVLAPCPGAVVAAAPR